MGMVAGLRGGGGGHLVVASWAEGPETAALYFVATLSPLLGFIMEYTFHYTYRG
jgi:hypothetical protein